MTELMVGLGVGVWLACGAVAAGLYNGSFYWYTHDYTWQGGYLWSSKLLAKEAKHDWYNALIWGVPFGVLALMISVSAPAFGVRRFKWGGKALR